MHFIVRGSIKENDMKILLKYLGVFILASPGWALEPIEQTHLPENLELIIQEQPSYEYRELDNLVTTIVEHNVPWTSQEKLCLAKNIFHEAANEPLEGQVAVAVVTLNRALNSDFPSTICDVVYQRNTFSRQRIVKSARQTLQQITWTVCQFTWTCQKVKPPRETDIRWQNILETVEHFSEGGFPTWRQKYKHSYNYHAYYVNPRWNLRFFTRTGAHLFYTRK